MLYKKIASSCCIDDKKIDLIDLNEEFSNMADMVIEDVIFYYDYKYRTIQFYGKDIVNRHAFYDGRQLIQFFLDEESEIRLIHESDLNVFNSLICGVVIKEKNQERLDFGMKYMVNIIGIGLNMIFIYAII